MSAFFFHDANFLFTAAIGIVVLLFTIEMLGMLFGASLLGVMDDLPDIEPDTEGFSGISTLTNWLSLDRLPLMIWLVLFLTCFGLSGYLINIGYSAYMDGRMTPPTLGVPAAIIISFILTGRFGGTLARILPKNESSALNNDDFVGAVGEITIGIARPGSPAEARFMDKFSQPHYMLVEPFESNDTFTRGDKIILIKKDINSWLATRYQ